MLYYKLILFFIGLMLIFLGPRSAFAISFTISNLQQSGNEVTIDVSLSGLTSYSCLNGSCYLQAAFTSPSPIRYFGFTKNNSGQWYEYISSPAQSYIQSTFFTFQPASGAWSGQLILKINTEDSNYHGPGTYNVNAWRYTGNSSSASGASDNVLAINIQSSTPTSTPTPTPSSTSTLSSNSSTSSNSSSSSFTISNTPSQINSDESFSVSINLLLPSNPNTNFFLKGAFKKSDGSNYFGYTKVDGNWIKNGTGYSNQYSITTDSSGNWTGNLEVKPDPEDSGFSGTSDYIFKVGRYTNSGSGPTWSNESGIKIIGDSISSSSSSTSSNYSKSSGSTAKSSLTPVSPSSKSIIYTSNSSNSTPKFDYQIASIAGTSSSASPSAEVEVKNEKRINLLPWIGVAFVTVGLGTLAYVYLHSRKII